MIEKMICYAIKTTLQNGHLNELLCYTRHLPNRHLPIKQILPALNQPNDYPRKSPTPDNPTDYATITKILTLHTQKHHDIYENNICIIDKKRRENYFPPFSQN